MRRSHAPVEEAGGRRFDSSSGSTSGAGGDGGRDTATVRELCSWEVEGAMGGLSGRTALVTGGATVIGAAVVRALREQGVCVAVADIDAGGSRARG